MGQFFDASVLLAHSKSDDAITPLQGLLKDAPQFAGAHYFLGVAYLQKQQLPQARAAIADAVKFNPQLSDARTALAQIHLAEGSMDLALEQAQAAVQINQRNVQAAVISGTAYLFTISLLKEATDKLPNEPLVHYHLGMVRAKTGDPTVAKHSLQRAFKLNQQFPGADEAKKTMARL